MLAGIVFLFLFCTNCAYGSVFEVLYPEIQEYSETSQSDPLYYARMKKGLNYKLVMERVTDRNVKLWRNYIATQDNPRVVYETDAQRGMLDKRVGSVADGTGHFRRILDEIDYKKNEVWIAYIMESKFRPDSIPDSMAQYQPGYSDQFADEIIMFVTVTSSPNALITSHMGIALSYEATNRKDRPKGISMDLHSFAAKVMLKRNPQRKFMINAPAFIMESIIEKELPPRAVYIGTKEMHENLKAKNGITFLEFKERYKDVFYDELTEKRGGVKRNFSDENLYARFRDPYNIFGMTSEESMNTLLNLMERHPPIISLGWSNKNINDHLSIYDTPTAPSPWLVIDEKNEKDYEWIFKDPFAPAGSTHYIAVDLQALSDARPLANYR